MTDLRLSRVRVTSTVAVAALTLAVTACGSSSSKSSSAPASGGATTVAAAQPSSGGGAAAVVAARRKTIDAFVAPGPAVKGAGLHGKSVWFIPISGVIPIVAPQMAGVKQAISSLGATFHTCDGKFIPATVSACITQAVNAGADGIITDAVDPTTVSTATGYAARKKVPIVSISDLGTDTSTVRFLPSADLQNAPIAADWIAADSGGKAKVVAATVSGDKGTETEAKAFVDELGKQCAACKIYSVTEDPSSSTKYASSVSTALLKHPDATYVFAQFDFLAPPVARGVQQSGHKAKLVSTTAVLANMQQVKQGGPQVADIAVNPNYYGWLAVDGLLRMVDGAPAAEKTALPIRIFDSSTIGTVTLSQAESVTGSWWGPTSYREEFPKLWGVG